LFSSKNTNFPIAEAALSRQIPNQAGLAAAVLVAVVVLSACSQRQELAARLLPANAQQMASHIELALERDQFRAAVEMGEAFLQQHADPEGVSTVRWSVPIWRWAMPRRQRATWSWLWRPVPRLHPRQRRTLCGRPECTMQNRALLPALAPRLTLQELHSAQQLAARLNGAGTISKLLEQPAVSGSGAAR
jgi:hypothetical protein